MTPSDAATLVRFTISFGALVLLFCLWRRHAVEKFRQQAFIIRDQLFDLAATTPDSEISFDSSAYRALRAEMNDLIRFTHYISAFRAMLFGFLRRLFLPSSARRPNTQGSERIVQTITDSAVRHQVEIMIRTLNWNIIKLCAKTSPPFCLVMLTVMLREWRKRQPLPSLSLAHQTFIQENEGTRVPALVKKATAQRMRGTHQAIWTESAAHAVASSRKMGKITFREPAVTV